MPLLRTDPIDHHEIRVVAVADLKPAPYNPRLMSDEALAGLTASLKRFGLVEPIIWNQRTGFVVGGHQRLKVLQNEGIRRAQVVVVDLPPEDEKQLNIALNNLSGEWDYEALKTLLADLKPDADARVLMGFSEREMNALLEWGAAMSTTPDAIGETPDDKLAVYESNTIKQIVLYFPTEQYIRMLKRLKTIADAQDPPLETHSDVFAFLVDHYENTARSAAPA